MRNLSVLISVLLLASACSSKNDGLLFDMRDGPATSSLTKLLPNDLRGDSENVRHGASATIGKDMVDDDGGSD